MITTGDAEIAHASISGLITDNLPLVTGSLITIIAKKLTYDNVLIKLTTKVAQISTRAALRIATKITTGLRPPSLWTGKSIATWPDAQQSLLAVLRV